MSRLEAIIRADPDLMSVLQCRRDAALPQWRLVAGCLYQTVWNVLTNRPRGTGIKDYDVIYFDAGDLSWEAEDAIIRTVTAMLPLEIRNQARVHLWYERHFGVPYPPLSTADEAMTRYPSTAGAVGVRLEMDGRLDIAAPFGLDDMFAMIMRPNPACPHQATFDAKVARTRLIWPEITVIRRMIGPHSLLFGGAALAGVGFRCLRRTAARQREAGDRWLGRAGARRGERHFRQFHSGYRCDNDRRDPRCGRSF